MTKILNFALKIKGGGRKGGTYEVLRPCHPPKIWNVHYLNKLRGSLCPGSEKKTKQTERRKGTSGDLR